MIDYVGDDGRTLNAVLVLDADGLYHLARIEYGPPSVETPLAPGFGAAARRTANALRAKDCAAFRKLIPRSSSKEDPDGDDACASVTIENSLANLLGTHPDAEPRLIGGNNGYAFYGIDSPEAGFTLILRHQPSSGYSYLDSLLTSTGMIRLPDAKESPGALANRVAENGSSSDCTEVYELNPLSRRPAWDVQTQCRGFQALARLDVADASAYGGGAIVEYKGDDGRLRTGVFMLDADGLYHLTGIDGFLAQSSVGTRFDRNFDEAAEEAVKALRDKDCAAFRAVALQRYGSGANPDALCDYVANNPLLNLLTLYPTAQPQRLGGNDSYAFYGIGSPEARFTIVMARESTSGPPGTPALPEDAPEYGFVDAFRVTGTDAQVTSAPPWRPTDNS